MIFKKQWVLAVLSFSVHFTYSQNIYLLGGLQFGGLPYSYKFKSENILSRGWIDQDGKVGGELSGGFAAAIHYRPSQRFAFELGYQNSEIELVVHDNRFLTSHGIKGSSFPDEVNNTEINTGNFDTDNSYDAFYASAYYFVPSRSRTNLYFNSGITLNSLSGQQNISGKFAYPSSEENLEIVSHYRPFFLSGFIESGIYIHPSEARKSAGAGPIYFIGLRYYSAGNVVSADYQNMQGGSVLYSDHVDSDGSYLAFTFRMGGRILSLTRNSNHHKNIKSVRSNKKHKSKSTRKKSLEKNTSNTRGW